MSLLIGDNLVVTMHYTLTDDEGNTLDSSSGADPLSYLHGAGNIIPGLEKSLVGKVAGDTLKVTVAPEEGYGEVHSQLMQRVPKEAFHGVDEIEVGMAFDAEGEGGQMQRIVVKEVTDSDVLVDANHPLAGKTLTFDVEIITVREATEEEAEHGHAH